MQLVQAEAAVLDQVPDAQTRQAYIIIFILIIKYSHFILSYAYCFIHIMIYDIRILYGCTVAPYSQKGEWKLAGSEEAVFVP